MTQRFLILTLSLFLSTSCKKTVVKLVHAAVGKTVPSSVGYVKYTIPQGAHYCDKNTFQTVSYDVLTFTVKFDSSAVYQTVSPRNQNDINKLYGFSDNNKQHHEFSARFGWRWSNNALRLFAYIYNDSIMSEQELGTVAIGVESTCSIKVSGNTYLFTLNGQTTAMPRASTTAKGEGYKLYPYFGGDETAPHPVSIWINEQ